MKRVQYDDSDLLGVKELMTYLNIGRDRAYMLMHNQSFPSRKIGKTYIVTFLSLKRWLNEQKD
ncbi:MAG: helix-turn-helix domain-containing protein [Eubacterium sp.]|nr:helix-turn-helix domain-containing protein [Eubacterium sp.]